LGFWVSALRPVGGRGAVRASAPAPTRPRGTVSSSAAPCRLAGRQLTRPSAS